MLAYARPGCCIAACGIFPNNSRVRQEIPCNTEDFVYYSSYTYFVERCWIFGKESALVYGEGLLYRMPGEWHPAIPPFYLLFGITIIPTDM